jgi:hypothetical protein
VALKKRAPRTTFEIDTNTARFIAAKVRAWRASARPLAAPPVVAIDGGSASAGWCFIDEEGWSMSGQGTPLDVEAAVLNATAKRPTPVLFVREGPYTVSTKQMADANAGGPVGLYRLCVAAGFITRGIFPVVRHAAMWEPMPTSWRAVFGLNRTKNALQSARDATADACVKWARAKTGRVIEQNNGKPAVDEAMAVCMAYTGQAIALAVERSEL